MKRNKKTITIWQECEKEKVGSFSVMYVGKLCCARIKGEDWEVSLNEPTLKKLVQRIGREIGSGLA